MKVSELVDFETALKELKGANELAEDVIPMLADAQKNIEKFMDDARELFDKRLDCWENDNFVCEMEDYGVEGVKVLKPKDLRGGFTLKSLALPAVLLAVAYLLALILYFR